MLNQELHSMIPIGHFQLRIFRGSTIPSPSPSLPPPPPPPARLSQRSHRGAAAQPVRSPSPHLGVPPAPHPPTLPRQPRPRGGAESSERRLQRTEGPAGGSTGTGLEQGGLPGAGRASASSVRAESRPGAGSVRATCERGAGRMQAG